LNSSENLNSSLDWKVGVPTFSCCRNCVHANVSRTKAINRRRCALTFEDKHIYEYCDEHTRRSFK
jgi:hypothetical protein